jgi:hypothetical protein
MLRQEFSSRVRTLNVSRGGLKLQGWSFYLTRKIKIPGGGLSLCARGGKVRGLRQSQFAKLLEYRRENGL